MIDDRHPARRRPPRLPGDGSHDEVVARMVRVDHAGEYGAVRIYEGQLAVLGDRATGPLLKEMADQEREHLAHFEDLIAERRVRPTALLPLWHLTGFALGAATALLGEKAAHACTVGVEEAIDEHYADQVARLEAAGNEAELAETFEQFRQDELHHKETALEHGAEETPAYELVRGVAKTGSRIAIWLSERI